MAQNAQGAGSPATNLGIVAWLFYGGVSGAGHWILAALGALAVICTIVAHEYKSNAVKIMSCTTAAFFAFALVTTTVFGPGLFKNYNVFLTWTVFAAVTWVTLIIGFPFTIQYAREQAPHEVWDHPQFMRLNIILSVVFGLMFTVNAVIGVVAYVTGHLLTLGLIVPISLLIGAIVFSGLYPKHYIQRIAPARTANAG